MTSALKVFREDQNVVFAPRENGGGIGQQNIHGRGKGKIVQNKIRRVAVTSNVAGEAC
jgi:hypothetical protein